MNAFSKDRGAIARCFRGCVIICLLAIGRPAFAAPTIFDEDWKPPTPVKPTEPVKPVAPPPPVQPSATKPAEPPKPIAPPQPAVDPLPKPPAAAIRRPVPAAQDQAKSRKLFKEVFATELADHAPAARRALGSKLLEQVPKMSDSPTDQFVLLVGAIDAGREASDLSLSLQAADELAIAYNVDGLAVKTDAATRTNLRGNPALANSNCAAGLQLIDELMAREDYVSAARLAQSLRAATTDISLSTRIQERAREIETARLTSERVTAAIQKLKTAPDDPAANLQVGQYLCLSRGEWSTGLPYLLKSGKPTWIAAAKVELAGAADTEKQVAVGDAWWDLSEKDPGTFQSALRQHAADFYRPALQSGAIAGLRRIALEKRLAVAATANKGAAMPRVKIIKADYGAGQRSVSIADTLQSALDADPYILIGVGNAWLKHDPAPGTQKRLSLTYTFAGDTRHISVPEGEWAMVPQIPAEGLVLPGASVQFKLIAARYGVESKWVDATEYIKSVMTDPYKSVQVKNFLPKDLPWGAKHFVVHFEANGRRYVKVIRESDTMKLMPPE